jgi:RNA polymerase sigma-70 factor (ECF subfamily)
MTVSERILIWNFRRGRPGAFDAIYTQYAPRVYRFCIRLTNKADDAEDLTQEVFVAAFDGLDGFQQRSSISTWLCRIALLRWRTALRKNQPCSSDISLDESNESLRPLVPDYKTQTSDRLDIKLAISALPESHRDAFNLVKAEGFTCREAGDVLGIPEGTVRYHVHCAITALRKSADLAEIAARISSDQISIRSTKTPVISAGRRS